MSLTAKLSLIVTGEQQSALDLGTGKFPFALSKVLDLASGTGASQADRLFTDTRTLAASATEDLDLAAALTDAFGSSLTFAKLKGLIITADAGNTNDVQLTRPATNGVPIFLAAGDGFGIKPGGAFALFWPGTGVTVTAATGDLLTLTNSAGGTGVTYSIVIIGTSA
jgi:hypothetical protein